MKATVAEDGFSVEITIDPREMRERRVVVDGRPLLDTGGHAFVFRLEPLHPALIDGAPCGCEEGRIGCCLEQPDCPHCQGRGWFPCATHWTGDASL